MTATDPDTAEPETTEIELVRAFLAHLETDDLTAAMALCSDDVVYQNVPLPADRGRSAVERTLRRMMAVGSGFEVVHHNIAADGPVVLTERTDILSVGRGRLRVDAAFWVCGTFEVHDGRITLWRDRFDWADFLLAWVRGAGKAILRSVPGVR